MDSYYEKLTMPDVQFKIKSFVSSTFEHVIEVHPHWHPEVEILYFISGCAKQQVNERFFTAESGDIVVIAKDQLHSTYTYKGSKCEILVVQFDVDSLLDYGFNCGKTNSAANFSNRVVFSNPLKPLKDEYKNFLDCIIAIHDEIDKKQYAYEYFVKSLIYKMIGIILRNNYYQMDNINHDNLQKAHQMLEKTFRLIDDYYFEQISLKKAAMVSNLSVTHFCRVFKKTTGMTFNDYLTFYRINRAEKMLHSSKAITEIALECGFGSLSSFIRNFKKYKKCTPSLYKKTEVGE